MLSYVVHRVLSGLAVLVCVTALTFWMLFARGGEFIASQVLGASASPEQVAAYAEREGLIRPIAVQYVEWFSQLVTGSLGSSILNGRPVGDILASAVPVTLSLILVSMMLTILLSVPLGVAAATRGGAVDRALQGIAVLLQAIPGYWLALVLVIIFGITLRWVPATGYVPITESPIGWFSSIILPSVAIALGAIAFVGTQLRGSLVDILKQDHIRTLRSRGISGTRVLLKYSLRNVSAATLTILAVQVIGILGGAIIVERIYALPGIGTIAIASGMSADVPVVMGTVVITVIIIVVVNLATDLANGYLNPRMRVK